jgi:hypothetical protein
VRGCGEFEPDEASTEDDDTSRTRKPLADALGRGHIVEVVYGIARIRQRQPPCQRACCKDQVIVGVVRTIIRFHTPCLPQDAACAGPNEIDAARGEPFRRAEGQPVRIAVLQITLR